MPDVALNIVGPGACSGGFVRKGTDDLHEGVLLECPDSLGEEAGTDKQDEVGHADEEDFEGCDGGDERMKLTGRIYLLVRLANWYMITPHARPLIMPTMAAMGMDVAGCASETPLTKTTASRPGGGKVR